MFSLRHAVIVGAFAWLLPIAASESQHAQGQPQEKLEPYINPKTKKDKADEQLEKLNARVTRDKSQPGHPVVEVHIYSRDVTADDLKALLMFKTIRRIDFHTSKVNGPGLAALANLPLEHLFLPTNAILDDEGLKALAKLKSLKVLYVPQSKFRMEYSNEAVKGLAVLTNLEELTSATE